MTLAQHIAKAILDHLAEHAPPFVRAWIEHALPALSDVIQGALNTVARPLVSELDDVLTGIKEL